MTTVIYPPIASAYICFVTKKAFKKLYYGHYQANILAGN